MDGNIDTEIAEMFAGQVPEVPDTPPADAESTPETNTNSDADATATSGSEDASKNNDSETDTENKDPEKQKGEEFSAEDKFDAKQNHAFAQMRTANKDYESFIMRVAKTAGLNVKTAQEAKEALEGNLRNIEAKKRETDPAILKELEDKDNALRAERAERFKNEALTGFAKVKSIFGLSDTDLNKFADQLVHVNKNPFEQTFDLVNEYRMLNFDTLINKAREEGRLAEVARRAKAQESSSDPGTSTGKKETGDPNTNIIKNVKDLDKFFSDIGLS